MFLLSVLILSKFSRNLARERDYGIGAGLRIQKCVLATFSVDFDISKFLSANSK